MESATGKKMSVSVKRLARLIDLAGAMLVTTGGTMLAIIPRIDLSLGGLMIALCGLVLMDLNCSDKLGFNKLVAKYITSPFKFMGYCGIACCVFLGGGEMLDIVKRGQTYNFQDPGYIKVLANLFPYFIAALMSFEWFRSYFKTSREYMVSFYQVSLFATGHLMIAIYGQRAGNSAYEIGAILFSGALLSMVAILLSNLKSNNN